MADLYTGHDSPIAALRAVYMGSVSMRGTPMRTDDGVCIFASKPVMDSVRIRSAPSMVRK